MEMLNKIVETVVSEDVQRIAAPILEEKIGELTSSSEFTDRVSEEAAKAVDSWASRVLGAESKRRYADVFSFFDEYVALMFPMTPETSWSPRWWQHPSVMRRMMLMWVSYEAKVAASPATGEEEWLRTVGHFHMKWMTSRTDGPFSRCRGDRDHILEPLNSEPMGEAHGR